MRWTTSIGRVLDTSTLLLNVPRGSPGRRCRGTRKADPRAEGNTPFRAHQRLIQGLDQNKRGRSQGGRAGRSKGGDAYAPGNKLDDPGNDSAGGSTPVPVRRAFARRREIDNSRDEGRAAGGLRLSVDSPT